MLRLLLIPVCSLGLSFFLFVFPLHAEDNSKTLFGWKYKETYNRFTENLSFAYEQATGCNPIKKQVEGCSLIKNKELTGTSVGFFTGAATGAKVGAGIGIAMGPAGAIAGTVPGAVIGGVIGVLGGNRIGKWLDDKDKTDSK